MKVTKRKTSYSLRVTPSEYEMINVLLNAHDAKATKALLHGNAKRAYSLRVKATGGDLLRVDKDISDRAPTGSAAKFGR